jgi:rubrerythrin
MATQLTLSEVLQKAIQREIESRLLYTDLSHRAKEQGVKEALLELALQEQGHQNRLELYLKGELKEGALGGGHIVDYKIAEHLEQHEISPDMKIKDVFSLAAKREEAAHAFYTALALIHPVGEMRSLFEGLANEEMKHKRRVELLYTEVAFPQTDGG